jgi:hypothetical protein
MGRVRSYKGELKFIGKNPSKKTGYFNVILSKNGISKGYGVHQLVAMAFLGHVPNGYKEVVDHIDENKTNNRLVNLRLVTSEENTAFFYKRNLPTGVLWIESRQVFWARIKRKGKVKFLGSFNSVEEASEAYRKALNASQNI